MSIHNERGEIINEPVSTGEQREPISAGVQRTSCSWPIIILVIVSLCCLLQSIGTVGREVSNLFSGFSTESKVNSLDNSKDYSNQSNNGIYIPTSTKFPTNTKLAYTSTTKQKACPGAPKQRLIVNEDAEVCTKKDNLFLRSGPGKSFSVIKSVPPGTVVWILDGPECANDFSWWKVKLPDGTQGWMAEGGDQIDTYYLCPN